VLSLCLHATSPSAWRRVIRPPLPCHERRQQAAKPLAAKLLSGAQNVSYQANATRDAAKQAVLAAHAKLLRLREELAAAVATKQAAKSVFKHVPAQWGKAQFKVRRPLCAAVRHVLLVCS
jgi:hypothetical protein